MADSVREQSKAVLVDHKAIVIDAGKADVKSLVVRK